MTVATTASANEILNVVAAEVGLAPNVDPYGSGDANFVQMGYLLNTACKELSRKFNWEFLQKRHNIITANGDSGVYPLPIDFLRMIDQTGWERNNRNPINSLSPQQWEYLEGRNLVSETIWVNFRVMQGEFAIYPQPVSFVYDIIFEYISTNCVLDSTTNKPTAVVSIGADVPMFDDLLLSRMVKVKWLEAKGFDSGAAQDDLNQMYDQLTAADTSSPILNAGQRCGGVRLLNSYNVGDTNYGYP